MCKEIWMAAEEAWIEENTDKDGNIKGEMPFEFYQAYCGGLIDGISGCYEE
jgi:hypothetical protein